MAIVLTTLTLIAACGILDGHQPAAPTTPPPSPAPALTKAEAQRALSSYTDLVNQANGRLDPRLAAAASTGSTLQLQTTKFKVYKANRIRIQPYRYGPVLSAIPTFTEHPKWFFAAMTDRGSKPYTRDIVVFVQEQPGGPWRAAYTPLTTAPITGPLAPGVDVADFPDVVVQDDAALVLPPARLSSALADVLNNGARSPHFRSITLASWMRTKYRTLREDKKTFQSNGWTGSAAYSAASLPVYAVRTTSGGALVWSAVELKENFRHTRAGGGITWEYDDWGDLLRPFTGRSTVKKTLTTVERIEVVAYVPPRANGRIRFLATRWAPISVQGY